MRLRVADMLNTFGAIQKINSVLGFGHIATGYTEKTV